MSTVQLLVFNSKGTMVLILCIRKNEHIIQSFSSNCLNWDRLTFFNCLFKYPQNNKIFNNLVIKLLILNQFIFYFLTGYNLFSKATLHVSFVLKFEILVLKHYESLFYIFYDTFITNILNSMSGSAYLVIWTVQRSEIDDSRSKQ